MADEKAQGTRREKLTSKVVKTAETTGKRYPVHDTEVAGFRLQVSAKGKKSFYLRYRVGGGRSGVIREPKIGDFPATTAEQARRIALEWTAEVRLGGDPGGDRKANRQTPSMAELFERYLDDHARVHKKPSSVRNDEAIIRNVLKPRLGRLKVTQISRDDVIKLHKSMQDTPYQANRTLALLSKAMNLAELWDLRPDGSNPTLHVKKYREKKRQRYLSPEETQRLATALSEAEKYGCLPAEGDRLTDKSVPISAGVIASIRLLLLTGARHSEILGLRWEWVDFAKSTLSLPDSKGNVRRTIYLNEAAQQVLRSIARVEGNPFVIVGAKAGAHLVNLKDPWRIIRKNAALEDFRLHDLRHSFASFAVASGMSLPMIGALLGHSQPATTARYAHLADDPLKAAAELVGGRILETSGPPGSRS